MAVNVNIGGNGRTAHATIIEGGSSSRYRPVGLAVYTQKHDIEYYDTVFATDVAGATNLALDGTSYVADTEDVHNGIDNAYWTASATVGTWTFNSAAQAHTGTNSIDATATVNGDVARFDAGASIVPSEYEYLEGWIYITGSGTGGGTKSINVQLYDSSNNPIGGSRNIVDYVNIDTLNSWQQFQIPLLDFGLNLGGDLDRLDIVIVNTSGQPIDFYLDDMRFTETGGRSFKVISPDDTHLNVYTLDLTIVDGTTVTGTDAFNPVGFGFGSALTTGLLFRVFVEGSKNKEYVVKTNADFLSFPGASLNLVAGNGTNGIMKLRFQYPAPLELNHTVDDRMELIVRDDLSGLTSMVAAAGTTRLYKPDGGGL